MKAEVVRAFLDAADDLLATQQSAMPHPLSEELRALTEAYVAARAPLLYVAAKRVRHAGPKVAMSAVASSP